jgi:hypothetical protein
METTSCQRWRAKRASYRPAGEPIATGDYEVASIAEDAVAKAFVTGHHYSGSFPAARFRFGLYRRSELVGVAVYSHPANDAVLNILPGEGLERTELGRFVLLDNVPANGESWFLARTFEELRRRGIAGVLAFSDPVARTDVAGRATFPGHIGTIYQATNAVYTGRGRSATLRVLPSGATLHGRALAKLRTGAKGWRYVRDLLVQAGAERPAETETDLKGWAEAWVPKLTRPVRHPGNHRYAWALDRRDRKHLVSAGAYPKLHLKAA